MTHPSIVHIPLAVALLAPLLDLLGLCLRRRDIRLSSLVLWGVGVVFSFWAGVSGQADYDRAVALGLSTQVLDTHADWANGLPFGMLLVSALRGWSFQRQKAEWFVFFVTLWIPLFAVWVGRTGGALVFLEGVGVSR